LTVEEIASYLRRSVDEVREELKYLELDKLVTRVKKGLIFKKEAYDLTPTGLDEAEKAFEKLRARADEFIRRLKSTNPDEVEEILNQYASLIPLLLLMGLDVLLLGPIVMHGNQ
jgi:Mn-dependent DtxR family transcriptional regulator